MFIQMTSVWSPWRSCLSFKIQDRIAARSRGQRSLAIFVFGIISPLLLSNQQTFADQPRTWTTANGRSSVVANFLGVDDGKVVLRREDNQKVVRVPINILSDADQNFVRSKQSNTTGEPPEMDRPSKQSIEQSVEQSVERTKPASSATDPGLDVSLYRGLMTFEGKPVVTVSPLQLDGFTNTSDRHRSIDAFWNHLIFSVDPDRTGDMIDAVAAGSPFDVERALQDKAVRSLYSFFVATSRGDTWRGGNEFQQSARAKKVKSRAFPRWVETMPQLPITVAFYDRFRAERYVIAEEHFLIPAGVSMIPTARDGVQFRYAVEHDQPITVPVPRAKAEAFVASSRSRYINCLTTIQIDRVEYGGLGVMAFCQLKQIEFFGDDQLKNRLHVRHFDAAPAGPSKQTDPADSDVKDGREVVETNDRTGADSLDARMLALAKQLQLPVHNGLPWFDVRRERGSGRFGTRRPARTRWATLMDLVELGRTPDMLGLSAFDPTDTDDTDDPAAMAAAVETKRRFETYCKNFIFYHFEPAVVAKYITTRSYRATPQPGQWAGKTQFDREDLQIEFIKKYRDRIQDSAVRLPLKISFSINATINGYDRAIGGFPIRHEGVLSGISLPMPISINQRNQDITVVPFDMPCFLPVDEAEARRMAGRIADSGNKMGEILIAYTLRIDSLPAARQSPEDPLPLIASVEAVEMFADEELKQSLHRVEPQSHRRSALSGTLSADDYVKHDAPANDPLLVAGWIAAQSTSPFNDAGWDRAFNAIARSDDDHWNAIRQHYGERIRSASANAFGIGRGQPARPYVNTMPHPFLDSPAVMPAFAPPYLKTDRWRSEQFSDELRQRIHDHLASHGKSVRAIKLTLPVDRRGDRVSVGLNPDTRISDFVASDQSARSATPLSGQLWTSGPNASGGAGLTGPDGRNRIASLLLPYSSDELMAQLSDAHRDSLSRENTESFAEILVRIDKVELLPLGQGQGELVAVRGTPERLTVRQIDRSKPFDESKSFQEQLDVVVDLPLANNVVENPPQTSGIATPVERDNDTPPADDAKSKPMSFRDQVEQTKAANAAAIQKKAEERRRRFQEKFALPPELSTTLGASPGGDQTP